MRDLTSTEIRRLHVLIDRSERRQALSRIPGKVHEVDAGKRLLRLKIGTKPDGTPVLSPWLRWQEAAAGGLKIHSEPAIGEQMHMVSSSGVVGSGSIATPGTYDKDNSAPSNSSDTAVFERGQARLEFGADGTKIHGPVDFVGGPVTNDGVPIGKTHRHTEVFRGSDVSGQPQP